MYISRVSKFPLSNLFMQRIHQPTVYPMDAPQVGDYNNIQLSDLSHNHLLNIISGSLKQKYLVPYQNNHNKATGILFGAHARPIICLPVAPLGKVGQALSVHFLVDTAAPTTYLSKEALMAIYGVKDLELIESTNVNIWGIKLGVNRSIEHWEGINILGANFLRKGNLNLQCCYDEDPSKEYCALMKKQ